MSGSIILAMGLYSFVLALSPGPNNTALLALAGRHGFRGTARYLWGMVVGLSVLVAAMAAGLGSLLVLYPAVFQVLKYLAFGYVLYLAWRTLGIGRHAVGAPVEEKPPIGVVQAAGFQLVNPKAWVATATLIAGYVPEGTDWIGLVVTAVVFVLFTMPGAVVWAAAGGAVSYLLSGSRAHRLFSLVMAVLLVGSMVPVLFLQ